MEIEFFEGDRARALQWVRHSVEMIREYGMAYMAPMILSVLLLVIDDPTERPAQM